MSFKREGDDKSQLNVLKKRRRTELLAYRIPEDEAFLTKNGRYACMVCNHRPVFDTLDVLTIHRNGKKHTANAAVFYERKQDLKNLVQKRKHESYLQHGHTKLAGGAAGTNQQRIREGQQHPLMKSAAYSVSRLKRKADRPRTKLDTTTTAASTDTAAAANSSRAPSTGSQASTSKAPSTGTHHSRRPRSRKVQNWPSATASSTSTRHMVPDYPLAGGSVPGTGSPHLVCGSNSPYGTNYCGQGMANLDSALAGNCLLPPPPPPPDFEPHEAMPIRDKRKEEEYYLKLVSSGWKRDSSGKWLRDDSVEFDSDEDEPPPFQP